MQLYDLEQLQVLRDPVTNTKALVAWCKDVIVIAFRGTANKQNALRDIQVQIPGECVCHAVRTCCEQLLFQLCRLVTA